MALRLAEPAAQLSAVGNCSPPGWRTGMAGAPPAAGGSMAPGAPAPTDLYAARLGRLRNRDCEREDAVLAVGLHLLGVERFGE